MVVADARPPLSAQRSRLSTHPFSAAAGLTAEAINGAALRWTGTRLCLTMGCCVSDDVPLIGVLSRERKGGGKTMGADVVILHWFERVVNWALLILLGVLVAMATIELYAILFRRIGEVFSQVETVIELQEVLKRGFGGILMVLLGLELIETVKSFATHHRIRLEVVFIVAMIAVGRHTILIDYEAATGTYLLGLGGLALSLGVGYWLVTRAHGEHGSSSAEMAAERE